MSAGVVAMLAEAADTHTTSNSKSLAPNQTHNMAARCYTPPSGRAIGRGDYPR